MFTQKIFQAGNSSVVAIPKELLKKLNLKTGQSVVVKADQNATSLIIEATTPIKSIDTSASQKAHQQWLETFMEENNEILDELAKR